MRQVKKDLLCLLGISLVCGLIFVQNGCTEKGSKAESTNADLSSGFSDAETQAALQLIDKLPDSPEGYTRLAVLYIKKARKNGDFALNSKADAAVEKALEIAPANSEARKLKASLHLTFHRFVDALENGNQLQKEFPNDAFVYGILTDANSELGNYVEAVAAAQKMVDLKPNSSSYARVAHLRSLHGDHAGAVEMYKLAAQTADPADKEAQSWCLVRLGDELWKNGKYPAAEKVYDEALQNFPGYYMALAGKGRIRAAQNDFAAAEKFLTDAQNRLPDSGTIIQLGDIYAIQNNAEKARQQYDLAEMVEQKLGAAGDQTRLALYWANHNIKLDEALAIASSEHNSRKDIYTADVLAWCLFKKSRLTEAKTAITDAMRLETKDAQILYHAAMIEKGLGNRTEAVKLLEASLKLNPRFDLLESGKAREALKELR